MLLEPEAWSFRPALGCPNPVRCSGICTSARKAGIVVIEYRDAARGTMQGDEAGAGHFTEVHLTPTVVIQPAADAELAARLHERAHEKCFIACSVNFPVTCEPRIVVSGHGSGVGGQDNLGPPIADRADSC